MTIVVVLSVAVVATAMVPVEVALVAVPAGVPVEVEVVIVVTRVEVGAVRTAVLRALGCAGALLGTFAEVFAVGMRDGVLIAASIDFLMAALADIILGPLTNFDAATLVGVTANAFVAIVAAFEFAMPGPRETVRCWAAFNCWPMPSLDSGSVVQARMPSYHV